MADKDPALCTLCYSLLKDSPSTENVSLAGGRSLILCSACSNQASQIQAKTNSSRKAAIGYMIDLIFSALISSAPPVEPRSIPPRNSRV